MESNLNMELSSVKVESLELDIDIKTENDNDLEKDTWQTYIWVCSLCHVDFKTVEELRSHTKEEHNMCNAFACFDCKKNYMLFEEFIKHIREHREALGSNCQYCKESFTSEELCNEHVNTHLNGSQKICKLCGEILPIASSLDEHKQLYGQTVRANGEVEKKSWKDYTWICQICSTKYPDSEALRVHAQAAHNRCFAFRCADCQQQTTNYNQFVAHVASHKPHLRNYCQYCNEYFPIVSQMSRHVVRHVAGAQRPCHVCGQLLDHTLLDKHRKMFSGSDTELAKIKTKRTYKKKPPPTIDELTCKICLKVWDTKRKLTIHTRTHNETRPRNYACPICNKAFRKKGTMQDHAASHSAVKTEICLVCKKEFHTKRGLKAHLLTHSDIKPFICDECGASFRSKRAVQRHLTTHSQKKSFKCSQCERVFKYKENLITHSHYHTGTKIYPCEICEKQFSTWINCDRHMFKKHGVKLAKTKNTAQGSLNIDKATGEVNPLKMDEKTLEWMDNMLKDERKRKDSNETNVA